VSRTDYPDLYAAVGTTYGAGDGSTTFNVPNLQGRVAVGLDATQTEFSTLGETGGANSHGHTLGAGWAALRASGTPFAQSFQNGTLVTYKPDAWFGSAGGTPSEGEGQYPAVMLGGGTDDGSTLQPYIAMAYIIKT